LEQNLLITKRKRHLGEIFLETTFFYGNTDVVASPTVFFVPFPIFPKIVFQNTTNEKKKVNTEIIFLETTFFYGNTEVVAIPTIFVWFILLVILFMLICVHLIV